VWLENSGWKNSGYFVEFHFDGNVIWLLVFAVAWNARSAEPAI
jgi:hypothetical protein